MGEHHLGDVSGEHLTLRAFARGDRPRWDRCSRDLGLARPLALLALFGVDCGAVQREARVAREVGLKVGLVADETTSDGIIRALVEEFGDKA